MELIQYEGRVLGRFNIFPLGQALGIMALLSYLTCYVCDVHVENQTSTQEFHVKTPQLSYSRLYGLGWMAVSAEPGV